MTWYVGMTSNPWLYVRGDFSKISHSWPVHVCTSQVFCGMFRDIVDITKHSELDYHQFILQTLQLYQRLEDKLASLCAESTWEGESSNILGGVICWYLTFAMSPKSEILVPWSFYTSLFVDRFYTSVFSLVLFTPWWFKSIHNSSILQFTGLNLHNRRSGLSPYYLAIHSPWALHKH